MTARNVWGRTVEENPDLDDFLYDEMERLADHGRFAWNIDPRRLKKKE
jgi:hypothetical protein